MVKTQSLRLSWRNQAGRVFSLSINNPRNNITQEEIEAFMDLAIQKNIFATTGGDLVAKYDAHLLDSQDQDFYTPLT